MSLKKTDKELMDFYIDCLANKREDRKNIAANHGIPYTKASTAYHMGCDAMCREFEKAKDGIIGPNFGKGAL